MSSQIQLVKEYKSALNHCKESNLMNPDELIYLSQVYGNLFNQSLQDLDDLTTLLTPNKTRMSDDERMSSIDNLYDNMQDKIQFLRSFNNRNSVLLPQRVKAQNEVKQMRALYGVKK